MLNSKSIKNIVLLVIMQGANYLAPLIITPYVIIKFGFHGLGVIAFSASIISFFRVVSNWGFETTATRDVAKTIDNEADLSLTINSVFSAKIILFIFIIPCISLITFVLTGFDAYEYKVFLCTTLIITGDLLTPSWYFIGAETVKKLTVCRVMSKFIFASLVIFWVDESSPLYVIPLIEGCINFLLGLLLASSVFFSHKIYPKFHFHNGINSIKLSYDVFVSSFSVLFYSTLNSIVLGLLSGPASVGIYSLSEKIYSALRGGTNPIIQVMYPILVRAYERNGLFKIIVVRFTWYQILLMTSISLFGYLSSEYIIGLLTEQSNPEQVETLNIFLSSLIFAVGGLTSLVLVIQGKARVLRNITLVCTIINILIIYPAVRIGGAVGAAYIFMLIQFIQFSLQLYYTRRYL